MIPFRRNSDRDGHRGGDFGNLLSRISTPDSQTMNRRIDLDRTSENVRAAQPQLRGTWLIGPLLLAAVGAGVLFVFRGPDHIFGIAFGLVLGLGFLWILVSTMFPSKPNRTCPQCASESLVRLDQHTTRGLMCTSCSWSDETASSFYIAEEEGTIEEDVLGERRPDGDHRRRW